MNSFVQLRINWWLVVWIPGNPLWTRLLLRGTPRIPNRRAPNIPNHQLLSKFCQQRLDPQLLDAWNGLGEAGSRERKENGQDTSSRREWMTRIPYVLEKMVVHSGWCPSCLTRKETFKRGYTDIPNKYPLYKVYMGFILKSTIPRVPPFSLWVCFF